MTSDGGPHPDGHLAILERTVARYGDDLRVTFSRYEVGPPGDQERRRRSAREARAVDVTRQWLEREFAALAEDEELALHSRVVWNGQVLHLFMLDFEPLLSVVRARDIGVHILRNTEFQSFNPSTGLPYLYTFETGRSYHQYADALIPEERWHAHLAELLLLYRPGDVPVIDIRWIAHALKRGYAALRWSHNTGRYNSRPRCVDRSGVNVVGASRTLRHRAL